MADASVQVIGVLGLPEVRRALAELPKTLQRKFVRDELKWAARLVEAEAERRAPVEADRTHGAPSGTLQKSIKVRTLPRSRSGGGYSVGVGEEDYKGAAFYGPMVELGHRIGKRPEGVKSIMRTAYKAKGDGRQAVIEAARQQANQLDSRSEVPPYPFLRPAFDTKLPEIEARLVQRAALLARVVWEGG